MNNENTLKSWSSKNLSLVKNKIHLIQNITLTILTVHIRPETWLVMSGAAKLMNNADEYLYEHLYAMSCSMADIKQDLDRTFGTHANNKYHGFRKYKHCLKRILIAYANFDSSLGYCQGMNSIAFFLIEIFGCANEEKAFWTFVSILKKVRFNDVLLRLYKFLACVFLCFQICSPTNLFSDTLDFHSRSPRI